MRGRIKETLLNLTIYGLLQKTPPTTGNKIEVARPQC